MSLALGFPRGVEDPKEYPWAIPAPQALVTNGGVLDWDRDMYPGIATLFSLRRLWGVGRKMLTVVMVK